jgi:hypothetical protein
VDPYYPALNLPDTFCYRLRTCSLSTAHFVVCAIRYADVSIQLAQCGQRTLQHNGETTCPWVACVVDCVWNVMVHAQKPDFVFRRNGRQFSCRRAVHISLQGLYCSCKPVFCSHVTLTGYPLHSLVSSSLPLPCVTVCHRISTGVYEWGLSACCRNILICILTRLYFLPHRLLFQYLHNICELTKLSVIFQ